MERYFIRSVKASRLKTFWEDDFRWPIEEHTIDVASFFLIPGE